MVNKFEAFGQSEALESNNKELPPGAEEFVGEELKNFRAEIEALQKDEKMDSENLRRVDAAELTEDDLKIHQELDSLLAKEKVSSEEAEAFFEKVRMHQFSAKLSNESRGFFSGYIAGQSMALLKKSGY